MELRPRKGRSAQSPTTPTNVTKPSPKPPPQSSSRKKPAPLPLAPIHITSDDGDADLKEIHVDSVNAALKDISYTDKEAAAYMGNIDKSTCKQRNHQDIVLPDSSEFETPLSSVAKLRCAQIKVASSKAKAKATSSIKKKMAEEMGFTQVADRYIANDRIPATSKKVELDEATTKVSGPPDGEVGAEMMEKQEALTGSCPQNKDDLAVEITLSAQEVCMKKTEVLSPSSDSKQLHSGKMEKAKMCDEGSKVVDVEPDLVGDQEHIADVVGPIVSESQTSSLILSDDEMVQVSDAVRVDGCEEKISSSKEASLQDARVSKLSCTSRKLQSNCAGIMSEESLSRKLFEEMCDVTMPCTDTQPDGQSRIELGSLAYSSKEGGTKIDTIEVEKYAERLNRTVERDSFKSPTASLKGREEAGFDDSIGDKPDASPTGIEEKDIVHDGVQELSEESSDEGSRDVDIAVELDAAITHSQKNVVHDEEYGISDGHGSNDSGLSGDDDDDKMASVFFSSMKAHLQRISEPSGLSMQKDEQPKQDLLIGLESQLTKCAVKKPSANGGLTGYGRSWSPEIVLSASKTSKGQLRRPQSIVEARCNPIWRKDQCLQDGLCVPPVDPRKLNKLARKQKDDTTGPKWFNLSAPTITPEIKKELQLVKLRGVLDPKRHYKADDSKGLPKFFQVGTVVGGPADFYSGRLTKKEQKGSIASELLSDSSITAYRKRKYMEIQDQKQAGGKGFWKKQKSKRTPAWAKI